MTAAAVVGGLLLLAGVVVDVFRTVLQPTSNGEVERLLARGLFRAASAVPRRWRTAVRRNAGPAAIALTVVCWLLGLLLGFALLYLPHVDGLSYSVPVADPGLAEALYLSGTALTTVGFGDVVATTTTLRLLTVLQGASGLALLTAALGYLPQIYTLVSALRTANQAVADLGAETPEGAAELLAVDAAAVLDEVRADVIASRQHLQRFPVLHSFHPPYDESVVALGRGALSLWVAAHAADDEGKPLPRQTTALEQALRRMCDDLEAHAGRRVPEPDLDAARRRFHAARQHSAHPEAAEAAEVDDDGLAFLGRMTAVLDAYADRNEYSRR